ncbi:permease prefix domain 1-containing protein [Hamadaea tsunoensis]|uniref:permease prefix domain 1-containing protein n=1 Tax=Hamadaea tsunoensis TaxID=53368 RepID=UPI0004276810|nr:permease prefix domain 1-containing protein [Hamadaea tsunoensis]
MTVESGNDLEAQIAEWRAYVHRRQELRQPDADELEDHLRGRIDDLVAAGLQPDEAFLIAVKRMGALDELSREFAREHSDRLWKQLVLSGDTTTPSGTRSRRDIAIMVAFAVAAAVAFKIPALFGLDWTKGDGDFYARNLGLFAFAPLTAYLAYRRRVSTKTIGVLAAVFVVGAVAVNAYPMKSDGQTLWLAAIHLPIVLLLAAGVAYTGGDWRNQQRRMDFIRFIGEGLIYYVLLALGGGVLVAFTGGTFAAIGLEAGPVLFTWVVPCGAMAAVVVAAWLVEAKQAVIENMAPVLTKVFTPLFTAALLALLVGIIWTSNGLQVEREVLILFDLLLVVILGLLLYAISARDSLAPPGIFDKLQLALVGTALIVDLVVLVTIIGRISEFGLTANKTAALGENLVLLANLGWAAWLLLRFIRRRNGFGALELWQTRYLGVFGVWAAVVVLAFPPIFNFA